MASKTLALMKARIADEIGRDDLGSQIEYAIMDAIDVYSVDRFFFNETRDIVFDLTQGVDLYGKDDYAGIADILKIDYLYFYYGGCPYRGRPRDPDWMEAAYSSPVTQGVPSDYCWYGQKLRLYPAPPDSGYSVRVGCVYIVAAPSSDEEMDNPWMNEAEMLIRARAKFELATHVTYDADMAAAMGGGMLDANGQPSGGCIGSALSNLNRRTAKITRVGSGVVVPMAF